MITIISSTNRKNSFTKKIADTYLSICNSLNVNAQIFDFQELPIDFLFSSSYGQTTQEFELLINKYLKNSQKYIFICPEYNGSIPGVLKSVIDCSDYKLYKSKKISLVGLSSGHAGNLLGIDHLTSIFHHLGSEVFSIKPKFSNIQASFENDQLTNIKYLESITNHIELFMEF